MCSTVAGLAVVSVLIAYITMKSGNEWMSCISLPSKQEIKSGFETLKDRVAPAPADVYVSPPVTETTTSTADTLSEPPAQGKGHLGRGSKLGATALNDAYKSQGIAAYQKSAPQGIAAYHHKSASQGIEALRFPPVNNLGAAPLMNPPIPTLGTAQLQPKQGGSLKGLPLGELQSGSLKKQGAAKLDLTPPPQGSRKQGAPNLTMTFPSVDTSAKPFLTIR
jgi:hypothetical protein